MHKQSGRSAPKVEETERKPAQISASDAKLLGNYLAEIELTDGLRDDARERASAAEETIKGFWNRLYANFQKDPKSLQGLQDWIAKRPKSDIPRLASSLARVEAPKGVKPLAVHTKDGIAVIEHAATAKTPSIPQAHRKIMRGAAELLAGLAALKKHDGADHKEFVVDCQIGLLAMNLCESIKAGKITPALGKSSATKKGIDISNLLSDRQRAEHAD